MTTLAPPVNAQRLTCPACQRFLAIVEGCYVELPPCSCGYQTTVRVVGRRARQVVEMGGRRLETK